MLELKPGEAVNDKDLAEELGVSRTPVREALIMLSMDNLVIMRPQSGTYIAPINTESVDIEQFTRLALEKEMINKMISLEDKSYLKLYEENYQLFKMYLNGDFDNNEQKLLQLDDDFHRIPFVALQKELIYKRVYQNMLHMERIRMLSLMTYGKTDRILTEHKEMYQGIIDGDRQKVTDLLDSHLMKYKDDMIKIQDKYSEFFKIK